jgi:Zn-dependent alcohol dehydrogenase
LVNHSTWTQSNSTSQAREKVLVRLAASGICHSCLHIIDGSMRWQALPVVLGDEGAGTVEQVGSNVTTVQPGDHVILSWSPSCGRCRYCSTGRSQLCERRPPVGVKADGTTRRRVVNFRLRIWVPPRTRRTPSYPRTVP